VPSRSQLNPRPSDWPRLVLRRWLEYQYVHVSQLASSRLISGRTSVHSSPPIPAPERRQRNRPGVFSCTNRRRFLEILDRHTSPPSARARRAEMRFAKHEDRTQSVRSWRSSEHQFRTGCAPPVETDGPSRR